jgi:hypothetical protein
MKNQLPVVIILSALLPVGVQAQLIAYEGFIQGTGNPALAGYSGTSSVGLSGTWMADPGNGQGMTITDGSGANSYTSWGTIQPNWPTAEHTAWSQSQYSIPMTSTLSFSGNATYYLSYILQTDQADQGSEVGFINSAGTEELVAGDGYSGASNKGITAFYANAYGSVQQNGNGTYLAGNWSGQMLQYQAVAEFNQMGGDLSVTLNYYLGSYAAAGGVATTTRTMDLGTVSDTFNALTLKSDGWNDIDEIYVGGTLANVITPVPEPSVAALGGLAILALFALKRKSLAC